MKDQEKRLTEVIDFLKFEDETSSVWPWAIPAETLIQSEEILLNIAAAIHLDETGSCDTEELYEAIDRIVGINPILSQRWKGDPNNGRNKEPLCSDQP